MIFSVHEKKVLSSASRSWNRPQHLPHWFCHQRHLGCLQPTPVDNHLIFANIQPADVCCKVTILHTILWSLEGCSTQCSFIYRVRMHGIPNRDIYWYAPHSNSSVHPRTATEAQLSEKITNTVKYGVVGQHHETPYFHSDTDTHPLEISLPRTAWIRFNASAPVSNVSALACINGVCLHLRLVTVV